MADEPAGGSMREVDESFAAFVDEHGAELLRFAYLISRDRARSEDLVQEALVKMLRRWRSSDTVDHPVAYARRIVVNEYLGWRRLRASTEVGLSDRDDTAEPDTAADTDDRDLMWRVLGGLAPRPRAVLVLRYYLQLSDREIAAEVGCAEATVRSIAARTLGSLRTHPQLDCQPKEA